MANIKAMEKLSKLTDENEKLRKDYAELLNDLKDGTQILDRLEKENCVLKVERDRLSIELAGAEQTILKLECEMDAYEMESKGLIVSIHSIGEELREENEKLKKENTELTERNKVLCSNINELRGQMVARRTVHPDIQNKCDRLKKENTELKSELKKLKKKIENGLSVEVEFRESFDMMPEIEMCDSKWDRFKKDGRYYGMVVIEG